MAIISNLIARLRADTSAFDSKMNQSRRHIHSFNNDIKMMGKQMLAIAGVGGGIYALKRGLTSIIKAASDAQEIQSKFNVVFREQSKIANAWAESFGKSVGRAYKDVKNWMAGLQDTFVPLGMARDEAYELSKSLVELGVDVASFNNAADATVIRDFTSALVGNHETVRKYGIIISESALKQEALNQGIKKSYNEFTDLEKVQLRYSLILKGVTDAQGDAIRTADSYANQLKRLYAETDNLKVMMGEQLMPVMADSLQQINKYLSENRYEIKRWISDTREGLEMLDAFWKRYWEWSVPGRVQKWLQKKPTPEVVVPKVTLPEPYSPYPELHRMAEENVILEKKLRAEKEKVFAIAAKHIAILQREIDITGRVGEAHWHAAKMVEFETEMKRANIETTEFIKVATEEYAKKLKELEKAQRLAAIAQTIGESFANTFERMIFEAEKFRDVMKSVLRDIAISAMRERITKPFALALTEGVSGFIEAIFAHRGGIVGQIGQKRMMPALDFIGAPRLHGGLAPDEMPAIVQRGERILPKGAGMPAVNVIINNNTGMDIRQKGQPQYDGENLVVTLEAMLSDRIQRNAGPLRGTIMGLGRSR